MVVGDGSKGRVIDIRGDRGCFACGPDGSGDIARPARIFRHERISRFTGCLRTGHIARPNEHGPGKGEPKPTVPVDVFGANLEDLAATLGL